MSKLTYENGNLVLSCPYDKSVIDNVRALPSCDRKWDGQRKVWIVAPTHGKPITQWLKTYLNEDVQIPVGSSSVGRGVTQIYQIRYLGTCKQRADGSSTAYGLVGNDWQLIFPEQVLRDWFDAGNAMPGNNQSLYSLLGTHQVASDEEIKSAYRRVARQWHPDVCKEANAADVFIRIQEAYEILSNPIKRAKYNAGLALQAGVGAQKQSSPLDMYGYRSPLRCGLVMLDGVNKIGRVMVEKILAWEDVTRPDGKILVTSWALGATEPTEMWS